MARKREVSLIANLHFYTYAAEAAEAAGLLKLYIFTIGITRGNNWLIQHLPIRLRKKLATRDLTQLSIKHVQILWLPELLQRGLIALKLVSTARGNWLGALLIDLGSLLVVRTTGILHFVNGLGLYTARRVKRHGATLICDMRAEHADFQRELLIEEYNRLGLAYQAPFSLVGKRFLAEYEIADYYVVPSSHAKKTYMTAGIEERRIFVVPYGVEFEHFNRITTEDLVPPNNPSYGETFTILYVGQVSVRKGIHYLIEAFNKLNVQNKKLVLVGGFAETEYEKYLRNLVKDSPDVMFVEHVPKVDLSRYYTTASIFVLPSLADSFGLVTLEAMACGLPVIVTENSGSSEIVREGVDGFIVPIRDSEVLANRLHLLACDSKRRQQMGAAAYSRAQTFTWKRYGEQISAVYETILQRAGLEKQS